MLGRDEELDKAHEMEQLGFVFSFFCGYASDCPLIRYKTINNNNNNNKRVHSIYLFGTYVETTPDDATVGLVRVLGHALQSDGQTAVDLFAAVHFAQQDGKTLQIDSLMMSTVDNEKKYFFLICNMKTCVTYVFGAGIELMLDALEHLENESPDAARLVRSSACTREQEVEELALVAHLAHEEGEALGGKATYIRLALVAEQRRVQLIHSLHVSEHVAPEELEQIGERLEGPLEHAGVLGVEETIDCHQDDAEVRIEVALKIARQLHGQA